MKDSRKGTRGAIRVRYNGHMVLLNDLAERKGLTKQTLFGRWKRAGRPGTISESLLFPVKVQEVLKVRLLPDNKEVSVHSLIVEYKIHRKTFMRRIEKGQKVFTRDELELIQQAAAVVSAPDAIKIYQDPNYLPHIKAGDLAHLSATKNLGRGKGEIPDEEWINRIRPKMQSNTLNCLQAILTGTQECSR